MTHTIGFEVDFPLLVSTAARGGGEYHLADDTASLSTALSGIVLSIFDNTGTFAAPAVPVNSFNRTQNLSDVFISVFQPTETARWLGNLKKYRLDDGVLVGQDGRPVIDPATGLFAAGCLQLLVRPAGRRPGQRRRRGQPLPIPSAPDGAHRTWTGTDLVAAGRRRRRTSWRHCRPCRRPSGTTCSTGRWAGTCRTWIRMATATEARRDMGDPFHVQPLTLLYSGHGRRPGRASVFLATNDGFLHAFDAETGEELWAFIPGRLLNGLYPLYRNEAAAAKSLRTGRRDQPGHPE